MGINKELSQLEFIQRESGMVRLSYEQEMEFYSAVASGDIKRVKELYTPLTVEGYGVLSKDPVRNLKYHIVIAIALIARFCIDRGMPTETAYTISDIFINHVDNCDDTKELEEIHRQTFVEYAQRMKLINAGSAYSKNILRCLDIIHENIHSGIKVSEIAEKLDISPQYLSKLFKKEVGMTISDFIMDKRIQAAKNMLLFSDHSPLDICNYLNFSSHSHFIAAFKKHTGMTPRQYRERYARDEANKNKKFFIT